LARVAEAEFRGVARQLRGAMANDWQVAQFEHRLGRAIEQVRVVLDTAKASCFADHVHHQYEDKYLLAEFLTNAAAASQLNGLAILGLNAERVLKLRGWAEGSAVSLRLRAEERCTFLREETRDVESPTKHVEELKVGGAAVSTLTSKVVTKVTEYFWKLEVSYEFLVVRGVGKDPDDRMQIFARTGHDELKTSAKVSPRPEARVPAVEKEAEISWLLRQLPVGSSSPGFRVDRGAAQCKTPRRNPEVDKASEHYEKMKQWARTAYQYLMGLLSVQPDPSRKLDLSIVQKEEPCVLSVLPLMRPDGSGGAAGASGSTAEDGAAAAATVASAPQMLACVSVSGGALLAPEDVNSLLAEESRALDEWRGRVTEAYPSGSAVATAAEGHLIVVLKHLEMVCIRWEQAMEYIEALLTKQLIAAIGKEVTPVDFAEYMRFHNRKLFIDNYAPKPFCFAVRRSGRHAPEGTLSIEEATEGGNSMASPIVTLAAKGEQPHPMEFPLSASTSVRFTGERYLHAWLQHKFSNETASELALVARARQFSSMLVLVGRIASATVFEPKYAAIVQNKDELSIPLELSTIPTPKEFKDAIESLSPEMKAFAKAFRAMQLESTLFGVLIIQIKPQLEKVLNLQSDGLTKEIKLTQDLMQLFIKYQIPSDLLSFDDGASEDGIELVAATPAERLEAVKGHVKAMQEMIEKAKEEEVAQRRREADYAQPRSRGINLLEEGCDIMFSEPAPPMAMMACAAPMPMMACAAPAMAMAAPEPVLQCASFAVPVPPPPPPQQQQQQQEQRRQEQQEASRGSGSGAASGGGAFDYTQVPKQMDAKFEKLDTDGALRPTIIKAADVWTKRTQKALLAAAETSTLHSEDQKREKDAAFDLLDALTKSGALAVDHAALHVVIAATHCFDKTVTETVIQDNNNPIDKCERSSLIMATTVHQLPAGALIQQSQLPRVSGTSPLLFVEDAAS